jgi:hypothetical protein
MRIQLPTVNPVIKRLALRAVREHPEKSFVAIAKEFGLGDRTLRYFAKEAGIQRPRGRKSWRVKIHPRDWTPLQRRIMFQAAKIREGMALEFRKCDPNDPCLDLIEKGLGDL